MTNAVNLADAAPGLDGSGTNVTVAGNLTVSGGLVPSSSFLRNRIINGDHRINQRSFGSTPANFDYLTDRWQFRSTQSSKFTASQSTTVPTGFVNSLLFTSSAATTPGASDQFGVRQFIEGVNVADLAWGTASAQTVTLSFWVRSSLTGTFSGALGNSGDARAYPFSYTISASNTWEFKTVTIPGDTSGTWLTTTGIGIKVSFNLGAGSSMLATAGSWTNGEIVGATGSVNVCATNGATWYVTGVQLEVGSVATPFERRQFGQELVLCQRYYYRKNSQPLRMGTSSGTSGFRQGFLYFPVTMRATPTVAGLTTSSGSPGPLQTSPQYSVIEVSFGNNSTEADWWEGNFSAEL